MPALSQWGSSVGCDDSAETAAGEGQGVGPGGERSRGADHLVGSSSDDDGMQQQAVRCPGLRVAGN